MEGLGLQGGCPVRGAAAVGQPQPCGAQQLAEDFPIQQSQHCSPICSEQMGARWFQEGRLSLLPPPEPPSPVPCSHPQSASQSCVGWRSCSQRGSGCGPKDQGVFWPFCLVSLTYINAGGRSSGGNPAEPH